MESNDTATRPPRKAQPGALLVMVEGSGNRVGILEGQVFVVEEASREPLRSRSDRGQIDLARLLLEQGAEIDARTDEGKTALSLASELNRTEMIKFDFSSIR